MIDAHNTPRRWNRFGGAGFAILLKGSKMLSSFVLANRRSPASCASIRLSSHASSAATIKTTSSITSSLVVGIVSSSSKGRFPDFIELPLPENDSWLARLCMTPACCQLSILKEGKLSWHWNDIVLCLWCTARFSNCFYGVSSLLADRISFTRILASWVSE